MTSQINAHHPVPVPAQLRWHRDELRMFVHFGMKTFYPSDNHMGDGREDPARFNPVRFDAGQWVAAAAAGGFKGIVLTTKHHDGFCNWQTDTTPHSVKSASWRNGQGDVVRELAEACRSGGLGFGIYVSIIDKHFELSDDARFANYGEFYIAQIEELSTRYGTVDEYWFDGFNAAELKMDYAGIAAVIREKQPQAVVYDSGTLVKYLPDRCLAWPKSHGAVEPDQDYRQTIEGKVRWYPNEPSLILQGNWFHNGEPAVSLREMQDDYLQTVGYGTTPLMNVSPNRDGLIDGDTVTRLKQLKAWIDDLHNRDLARRQGVSIEADHVRGNELEFAVERMLDGAFDTYYAPPAGVTRVTIEVRLAGKSKVDGFIIQEYIPLGQRVNGYAIDCLVDDAWREVARGQRIGHKRIHLEERGVDLGKAFPETHRIRLRILDAEACPLISAFKIIGR